MRAPMRNLLVTLAIAAHSSAHAQSMLRVVCDGDDVGAEVSVNGKVKGTCPVDMLVEPGTVKLRVEKKVAGVGVRVFEQEMLIGTGVRKKVEAVLSLRLNAEGQKREEDALWKRAEETATRASMKTYLDKYPNGRYATVARQKDEEYQQIPPRPQIPLAISEDIWRTIEASEAYRNIPKSRSIKTSSNQTNQTEYTGPKFAANRPPSSSKYSVTRERIPLGERCAMTKGIFNFEGRPKPTESEEYFCGSIRLGRTSDGKPQTQIKSLDELRGSLFPMRIGAKTTIRYQNTYVSDSKYDSTNASSCEVMSKGPANELDARLAGTAWKVHCQSSYSLSLDNKTKTSETDDFYLEDLGVMLSSIGSFDASKGKAMLPSPGLQTTITSDGDYGTRTTSTYLSHEWAVGK